MSRYARAKPNKAEDRRRSRRALLKASPPSGRPSLQQIRARAEAKR